MKRGWGQGADTGGEKWEAEGRDRRREAGEGKAGAEDEKRVVEGGERRTENGAGEAGDGRWKVES